MHTSLSWSSFFAVGAGAAVGAWMRWGLGLLLNPLLPSLPLGTLVANLLGGYLMGLALGLFQHYTHLSPAVRLLATTGFLGGLTTFSTFSAEMFHLFDRGAWSWLSVGIAAHVVGSILLTWLGVLSIGAMLR